MGVNGLRATHRRPGRVIVTSSIERLIVYDPWYYVPVLARKLAACALAAAKALPKAIQVTDRSHLMETLFIECCPRMCLRQTARPQAAAPDSRVSTLRGPQV